jgi:hypothetical protein
LVDAIYKYMIISSYQTATHNDVSPIVQEVVDYDAILSKLDLHMTALTGDITVLSLLQSHNALDKIPSEMLNKKFSYKHKRWNNMVNIKSFHLYMKFICNIAFLL